jgi:hypothetical protein
MLILSLFQHLNGRNNIVQKHIHEDSNPIPYAYALAVLGAVLRGCTA